MIVRVNNLSVDLDLLRQIGHGKDGDLYLFEDLVIKINKSHNMTEEKIFDLQVARDSNRLLVPLSIVNPTSPELLRAENPCFGYTTRYLPEDKLGLLNLTTLNYLEQIEMIKREIHRCFTPNEIAITDTNPHNLLISSGVIHLIDFDRCVTKSSMYPSKEMILKNGHYRPYEFHNNTRMDMLTYRGLLLSLVEYCEKEKVGDHKVRDYILDKQDHPEKYEQFVNDLLRHRHIYDYAKEKVKTITK